MDDPALRTSLSPEDIEYYARGADFQIVHRTTPGLTPLTRADAWFFWAIGLFLTGLFYVDLYVYPFLPFEILPFLIPFITVAFYLMIGIGILMMFRLVFGILHQGSAQLWARLFPRQPFITCPRCTARSRVKKYIEGQGCSKCHSRLVYCAKCGKSSEITGFIAGVGCPHCGHNQITVSW
jgi:hypothetical protein